MDRGRARNVQRERDLAEVVTGAEDGARAKLALADGEEPGEDDVEAVTVVALLNRSRSGGNILPPHLLCELRKHFAWERVEELDS